MQQTAVEWLVNEIDMLIKNEYLFNPKWEEDMIKQALEIEKQQQGYSEEEVLKSFDNLGFKQITSEELNSLSYEPFITDEDGNIWVIDKEKWFKQFKKK